MLRLKELRKQQNVNQKSLAIKLDISQTTISTYETGVRNPDIKTLINLANFFNVSIDYLVGLSDIKRPMKQSDLTNEELEILYAYRQSNKTDKEKIKSYIDGLHSKL